MPIDKPWLSDTRGVYCSKCGTGGMRKQCWLSDVTSGNKNADGTPIYKIGCPTCKDVGTISWNTVYDGKDWPNWAPVYAQNSMIDTAIAAGAPIDRTKAPAKDMRVRSFEEKEAELEQLRRNVAKEMGWET